METRYTPGIFKEFDQLPDTLKTNLEHFPELANNFPWDISLSYLFARIELAQNKAVHGAIVKLHRVDTQLARKVIDNFHMSRKGFREVYQKVTGKTISADIIKVAEHAESIRDKILHGKSVSEADKRSAVLSALRYAHRLNEQVARDAEFRPFGDMRGFKGRANPLDKKTSRWILMGMGLIGSK